MSRAVTTVAAGTLLVVAGVALLTSLLVALGVLFSVAGVAVILTGALAIDVDELRRPAGESDRGGR